MTRRMSIKTTPKPSDHQYFHSSDPKLVATPEKVKVQLKFPTKYLIWHAMDKFGNVSKPYVY